MVSMVGGRVIKTRTAFRLLLFLGVFFLHQLAQAVHWHWPLADNHLDPILAVPVMLGIPLALFRLLNPAVYFYRATVFTFTLGLCLVFEGGWIEDPRIHADLWDVPLYWIGAILFEYTLNRINGIQTSR